MHFRGCINKQVKIYLSTSNLNINPNSVIRIFLATANSVKSSALEDQEMNDVLKDIILRTEIGTDPDDIPCR